MGKFEVVENFMVPLRWLDSHLHMLWGWPRIWEKKKKKKCHLIGQSELYIW